MHKRRAGWRNQPQVLALAIAGVWLAGVAIFVVLAYPASEYSRFPADLWLTLKLQSISWPLFDPFITSAETLASPAVASASLLVTSAAMWFQRRRNEAALLIFPAAGWLLNTGVKQLVERPRPSQALIRVTAFPSDPSFPSGHVIYAVLLFGIILYLSTVIPTGWARWPLRVFCVYCMTFTGVARVYHGAHWPSDVYGSLLEGLLVLVVAVTWHKFQSRRRPAGFQLGT